jgi:hypothetical protein
MARPTKPDGAPVAIYEPLSAADREAVLRELERCPTLTAAARAALGERRVPAVIACARNDLLGFGAAVEHAKEAFRDSIRAEIVRRGVTGVERPLSYQGELTGHSVTEYSDECLKIAARLALKGEYVDKVTASDHFIHGEISIEQQQPGMWSISDQEALALPDDLKTKLADVLRYLVKHRREITREADHFAALPAPAVDAEFIEIRSDEYDLAELQTVF